MNWQRIKTAICQGDLFIDSRRRSLVVFLIGLLLPAIGQAGLKDVKPCLSTHLREAIKINEQRAPVYERLSQGQSRAISEMLIKAEKKVLWVAPLADAWAAPYQRAGIPILCADFIDMSHTPAFRAVNPDGKDSLQHFHPAPTGEISERLRELFKAKDYDGIVRYADEQVQELNRVPRYNCMVRHVLESIRRMAGLAPIHDQKARAKLHISSLLLSRTVLKSHINLLDESSEIDALAAPLQAEALPIICQDVPHIPWP
nr:hypothetical protein [uncultured Bdellovibrio sp.]